MRATPTIVTPGRVGHSTDWEIIDAPPIPGACSTDIRGRVMRAPVDPGDLEDAIRGHEMIHAGWSPIYTSSEIARVMRLDADNISSAEEWRVNVIAFRGGIDSTILHDPADVANAEKIARARTLAPALRLIVQTHGTNAHRKVLKALRKHGPEEWHAPIEDIQKTIRRARRDHVLESRRVSTITGWINTADEHASNPEWTRHDLDVPAGFLATLDIAHRLDRWNKNDPTPTREQERAKKALRKADAEAEAKRREEMGALEKFRELPEHSLEGTDYEPVRLATLDHTLEHRGRQARRRIASDTGKNPRRVSRWIDDPARRVFDRRVKARGGVVLIDQSGSMSLEREDIDRLLEQAGGAVVIGYSNVGARRANVWVHAQNGQRSSNTPTGGQNNTVDGSALMYALSRRAQRRDPVIWVTDGRIYERGNGLSPETCEIVRQTVKRHNVTMVRDIDEAIRELGRLARGNNPRTRVDTYVEALAHGARPTR